MTYSDVLEMELVLIEHRDMLYAMDLRPSQAEIGVYLDRQARKHEILQLLAKLQRPVCGIEQAFPEVVDRRARTASLRNS